MNLLHSFFCLASIIGALPQTLTNGTTADATQVMADLNWIVNQVNANAVGLASNNAFTGNNSYAGASAFNGLIISNLTFTDNTYDIGASSTTRPRNYYGAGSATLGGNVAVGGALLLGGGMALQGGAAMMSPITNSLSGGVLLNNVSNYFDGPSVAQGSVGTWFASGTVTFFDSNGGNVNFSVKLWDGTTVISSCRVRSVADGDCSASLSGFITNPAGNIRISVKDEGFTTGHMVNNDTGAGKDSTITAIRIG